MLIVSRSEALIIGWRRTGVELAEMLWPAACLTDVGGSLLAST